MPFMSLTPPTVAVTLHSYSHSVNDYMLKNSLAVKKGAALFKITKSCEIKGGGQEMAAVV